MPAIHAGVHKAQGRYRCDGVPCGHYIHRGDEYLRLYGYGERGERPRRLRLCMGCGVVAMQDPTVRAALERQEKADPACAAARGEG